LFGLGSTEAEASQYHGMGGRDEMPTHPLVTNSLYTIAEQTDLM